MEYSDLVSYVAEQSAQGIAADTLRQVLMGQGWKEAQVDNALHDVAAGLMPVTAGASIHEDLAQVRGMVAHLASRVKMLEMQLELPSPDAPVKLMPPRRHSAVRHVISLISAIGVFALLGMSGVLPLVMLVGGGIVLFGAGFAMMRFHWPWPASFFTDSALALWAAAVLITYQAHMMEWSTALGLAVLVFVLLIVMERWIDRLAK